MELSFISHHFFYFVFTPTNYFLASGRGSANVAAVGISAIFLFTQENRRGKKSRFLNSIYKKKLCVQ
jgi:hypothetical protein